MCTRIANSVKSIISSAQLNDEFAIYITCNLKAACHVIGGFVVGSRVILAVKFPLDSQDISDSAGGES